MISKNFTILALALAVGLSFGSSASAKIVNGDVDCTNGGDTQSEMNYCEGQVYKKTRSEYAKILIKLHEKADQDVLKAKADPNHYELAYAENFLHTFNQLELAFKTYRLAKCNFEVADSFGGSIVPLAWAGCMDQQLKEHVKALTYQAVSEMPSK